MTRAEWEAGWLEDRDDEREWLAERAEWEAQKAEDLALAAEQVSTQEMIAKCGAERAQVEEQSAVAHERAWDGWRVSYPRENVA